MAIASSCSRFASWYRSKTSPHLGQARCRADGTEISSPLTRRRSVDRFSTMLVPQIGQASSGTSLTRGTTAELRSGFFLVVFIFVKRDHDALVAHDDFEIERRSRVSRFEQIHPLACRR